MKRWNKPFLKDVEDNVVGTGMGCCNSNAGCCSSGSSDTCCASGAGCGTPSADY